LRDARVGLKLGTDDIVFSQDAYEPSHLGQRLASAALDLLERGRVWALLLRLRSSTRRLEHNHAEVMGDDVVQLAGDPRALLGAREPRLLLQRVSASGQCRGLTPLAQHDPGEPRSNREYQEERTRPLVPA
jgi:hypothetical protein